MLVYRNKYEDRKEKLNTADIDRPTRKKNNPVEKIPDTNRPAKINNNLPEKILNTNKPTKKNKDLPKMAPDINTPTRKDTRYKQTYQRGY